MAVHASERRCAARVGDHDRSRKRQFAMCIRWGTPNAAWLLSWRAHVRHCRCNFGPRPQSRRRVAPLGIHLGGAGWPLEERRSGATAVLPISYATRCFAKPLGNLGPLRDRIDRAHLQPLHLAIHTPRPPAQPSSRSLCFRETS
jgi:hypothetical protein